MNEAGIVGAAMVSKYYNKLEQKLEKEATNKKEAVSS
jgi:hypothetical protein